MELPLPETSKAERNWATGCHLGGLAGYTGIPAANIIAPLVIWLIKRDTMPLVADQGKEAVNFQISLTIYVLLCLPLCLIFIGFILLALLAIVSLVLMIIAAMKASEGVAYRYPFTIRFVK